MIDRADLALYLHQFLQCNAIKDYAPNGLQIEGRQSIRTICTAVTASLDAIEAAIALKADALLVHHGYFWRGETAELVGMKRARIALFIHNNLNLFAYHLPLDCHSVVGNNAQIGKRLDLNDIVSHTVDSVPNLLWMGSFLQEKSANEVSGLLQDQLQRAPIAIEIKDKPIKRLAWCSGAAQHFIENAFQLGADAYISGEVAERTYYQAKELGIHYFAAGHHATERYGIKALGEHLSETFALTHHFIDSDNPI